MYLMMGGGGGAVHLYQSATVLRRCGEGRGVGRNISRGGGGRFKC